MLPKTQRLSAAEVREILKSGASIRTAHLLVKHLPLRQAQGKPFSKGRAAAVVSKKIAKSAVARNQIRRALYRALVGKLPKAKLVLMAQRPAEDFTQDIDTLCSKLS